jgi:hypothetical protein
MAHRGGCSERMTIPQVSSRFDPVPCSALALSLSGGRDDGWTSKATRFVG